MTAYVQDYSSVKKARVAKECQNCGKTLGKGEPRINVTVFNDEFYNVAVCNHDCLSEYEKNDCTYYGDRENEIPHNRLD